MSVCEDKPAAEIRREVPIGKPDGAVGHSILNVSP